MSDTNGVDEATQPSKVAIGMSFGNSYSSVAYITVDGKAEVIANEEGDRQIPTALSYVSGEEYHGAQAKAQVVRNPRNTIAHFRDFMGKAFSAIDPTHCHMSAHPQQFDSGKSVAFTVQEHVAEDEEAADPEKSTLDISEVATRHIRRLKQSASDYLGKDVNAAVVTIPSDFSDAQKTALSQAASAAGVEILQYIPEQVSALLAHDAKLQLAGEPLAQQDQIFVVADIGGTRTDVAVVASRGGIYTTLATVHDYELGGASLDQVLIEYAAKEFLKKNKNASDPRKNERSLAKLTLEAEAVRKALSLGSSASFSIENLADGIDFSLSVNRTRFELLANKVLMSINRSIESAVQKAGLDVLDVDTILLSGGVAHTPKIASSLQSHFPESTTVIAPSTSAAAVNPSELQARGAAVQAQLIAGFERSDVEENTEAVVTVTPHFSKPIGLVTADEHLSVIIDANTPVPVRRTAQIAIPNGGDVLLRIAEGTREIKVTQQEKPVTNGNKDDSDDSDDDDSDDEPEEVREKIYKPGQVLAEAAVKGVKKGGKVEVQINIAADLSITIVCRDLAGKGGVRGSIEGTSA